MRVDVLAGVMDVLAESADEIDPAPWESYDREKVLYAVHRLDISLHGLADRIRAAGVNDTPVPMPPTKPTPPPTKPPKGS